MKESLCILFALAALCAAANEPIRWCNGDWDETGAPKGKLLSDNPGWWGERVWTGVTYEYEDGHGPNNPRDIAGGTTAHLSRSSTSSAPASSTRLTYSWASGKSATRWRSSAFPMAGRTGAMS